MFGFKGPPPPSSRQQCLSHCFFKHSPTVGVVPHFAPSGAPPLGQNTDTNVSSASHVAAPSD
jgi:hypothetical protein